MTGAEAYRRAPPSQSSTQTSNRLARQQSAPDGFRLKTARGALITSSLPTLQNLIKRSSDSYAEEFGVQWARFGSLVRIVQLGMGGAKGDEESLREVTGFVCQVSVPVNPSFLEEESIYSKVATGLGRPSLPELNGHPSHHPLRTPSFFRSRRCRPISQSFDHDRECWNWN